VHEPELGVDQIQVVVHALAFPPDRFQPVGAVIGSHLERPARLHHAEHAHDPFGDPVTLRDSAGRVLLGEVPAPASGMVRVAVGPPRLGGQTLGVGGQLLGGGRRVLRELGQREAELPQHRRDRSRGEQAREMTLEDHPVEHRQGPYDAVRVDSLEQRHGQPPLHPGEVWSQLTRCAAGQIRRLRPPARATPATPPRPFGCGRRLG
jgi:hypothetical protein